MDTLINLIKLNPMPKILDTEPNVNFLDRVSMNVAGYKIDFYINRSQNVKYVIIANEKITENNGVLTSLYWSLLKKLMAN